jgi:hypothetical protein
MFGGCHIYGFDNMTNTFTYYCELNDNIYANIHECVANCGLYLNNELIFPNFSWGLWFLVVFGLSLVFAYMLAKTILEW